MGHCVACDRDIDDDATDQEFCVKCRDAIEDCKEAIKNKDHEGSD